MSAIQAPSKHRRRWCFQKLTGAILSLNGALGVDVGVGVGCWAACAGCAAGGDAEVVITVGIIRRGGSGVGSEKVREVGGGDDGSWMVEACSSNNKAGESSGVGGPWS